MTLHPENSRKQNEKEEISDRLKELNIKFGRLQIIDMHQN